LSTMTPQQWNQVKLLFKQLMNLEPSQEKSYLDHNCQDEGVRKEVESLLFHHRKACDFLPEAKTETVGIKLDHDMPRTIRSDFKGTSRFLIQKRLGEGGFGVVYQAYDLERGSVVALKTLHHANAGDLYRFKKEFRSLAGLVHPNLAVLYELFSEQEQWFFTMEMINGINFLEYVKAPQSGQRHCQANLSKLRAALRQLGEGLCVLHRASKLHRDIKPSNVLVTREGRVVILDFGLVGDLTSQGVHQLSSKNIFGTPAFMSPEQATENLISAASDCYSVGVILFEALTGKLPFDGGPMEILINKQRYDPPSPCDIVSGIPNDLNTLCMDLLQRDPKLRPTATEILRFIGGPDGKEPLAATATTVSLIRSTTPFVGRGEELAILNEAWQMTKQGRGVTVFIKGRSGIGKSALARHFLEKLESSETDLLVFSGRCYEQESVPYKALDSIIDLLSRYLKNLSDLEVESILPIDVLALARLFPVLQQVDAVANSRCNVLDIQDSKELRRKAFGALRELLVRLANKKDLILFIDDLQWGDLDSAALVSEILRPPDAPRLLLIGSYRSEEADTSIFLKSLSSTQTATGEKAEIREIAVEGLSTTEAQKLATVLLGEARKLSRAEVIVQESGGSPFFIGELAQYALMKTAAKEEADIIKMSIDKVVSARIAQLPDEGRRLLEIVAVSGQPLARNVAKKAAEIEADEQLLQILRSSHLLRSTSVGAYEEIDTYHDRIREAVITSLSSESQKNYHHCLAIALEAVKTLDAERLAKHFQLAGESEKACDYTITAAEQAAEALAFDRAAQLYQQTLALRPATDPISTTLKIKLADALVNAGRGSEAAKVYLVAAKQTVGVEAAELQRRAAEQLLITGHVDEGIPIIREVLQKEGIKFPRSAGYALATMLYRRSKLRLRGLNYQERAVADIPPEELTKIDSCWSAAVGLYLADFVNAASFSALHSILALDCGEPFRVMKALITEVSYYALSGGRNLKRSSEILQMISRLEQRLNDPIATANSLLAHETVSYFSGRWREAVEYGKKAEEIMRRHGAELRSDMHQSRICLLNALFFCGEMKELSDRLHGLVKETQDRSDILFETYLRMVVLYRTLLASDRPDVADSEMLEAIGKWSNQGFHFPHWWCVLGRVCVALYRGEGMRAWQLINEQWAAFTRSFFHRYQLTFILSYHLHAYSAIAAARGESHKEALLRVAEMDAKKIERENMAWGYPIARAIRAGISIVRDDSKTAIELLERAEREFRASDMLLYAAAAKRRRGELIDSDDGLNMIREADEWMSGQKIKNPERMTNILVPGKWQS
jgi:eukaryotic-like serine/threonine-protein kinase